MPTTPELPPIVIVDDNVTDISLTRRLLQDAKIPNPIFTFNDGKEAVEFLEAVRRLPSSNLLPIVLFLDIGMVRMNGLDVINWIRLRSDFDGMRIIVLTSGGENPNLRAKVETAGADGFYAKFPAPDVVAKIVAGAAGAD